MMVKLENLLVSIENGDFRPEKQINLLYELRNGTHLHYPDNKFSLKS